MIGASKSCARRIKPMKKVAKTLLGHRKLNLNYFRGLKKQFSNSVIEGLNNKAKLTMRKAYGFRTFPASNSLRITHWENYQSQMLPTNSTDEPIKPSEVPDF
jgi:transposase